MVDDGLLAKARPDDPLVVAAFDPEAELASIQAHGLDLGTDPHADRRCRTRLRSTRVPTDL